MHQGREERVFGREVNRVNPCCWRRPPDQLGAQFRIRRVAQFQPGLQLFADSLFFRAWRNANITTEFSQAGVDAKEYSALEGDARIDNRAVNFELAHKMAEQLCGFEGCVDGFEFSRKTAVHLIAENT